MLLIHQTEGCIREGQEPVIVGSKAKTIAREATDKELQLIIRPTADMDGLTAKDIFYLVGHLIGVRSHRHGDNKAVMGIDKHLAITLKDILNTLNILRTNLVGGIRDRLTTVLLGFKRFLLLGLIRNEDNLVVNDAHCVRDAVYLAHDINGHRRAVDSHIHERTQRAGKTDIINVKQRVYLRLLITHKDLL